MKYFFSLVLLFPFYAANVSAELEDLPPRKAGLWEISTVISGIPGQQTAQQCIDAKTDAKMLAQQTQGQSGGKCKKNKFNKTASGFTLENECTIGGQKVISKTSFSGDFTSNYGGSSVIRYDPPTPMGEEMQIKINARWIGPCKPGQKPGDIIVNGMTMNIDSIMK